MSAFLFKCNEHREWLTDESWFPS